MATATSTKEQAQAIHSEAIVIDGCSFFSKGWDERQRIGGVTAMQMTVPWPNDGARQAIRRYEAYFALAAKDPRVGIVRSVEDIRQYKAEGRTGYILGAQNARLFENDLGLVEVFERLGVRVVQLSYNERNLLADGCLEPTNAGLSSFGKDVVREMNRVGIQIDLTHVGERSSLDAIALSEKPCIFSHSNPKQRADHPRNITDEQIKACAQAGGVIGLSPWAHICWTGGATPPTLDDLVGHIEYVVDLVGVDHVAIGTDSEATPGAYPPELHAEGHAASPEVYAPLTQAHPDVSSTAGLTTMEELPNLTSALVERGWQARDIKKLLGENLMRVYGQSWGED